MPYYVGRVVDDIQKLIHREPAAFERQGIQIRLLTQAAWLDMDRRRVVYRHLPTETEGSEPFDDLLLAAGSRPLRPEISGIGSEGVFGIHNLDDAERLRRFIDQEKPRRAAVVGAGYVGLEMADALRNLGLQVDLVGRSAEVMSTLDQEMGHLVSQAVRDSGVTTYLGEAVRHFEVADGRVVAVVTDRRTLPTNLVILGLGVGPNADLAAEAGLQLGVRGSVKVDKQMRTSQPGIWAAGDCTESYDLVGHRAVWASLATFSSKTGRIAGLNLTGGEFTFPGILQTAITGVGGVEVARTGLSSKDVEALGIAGEAEQVAATTAAAYLPQSQPMVVRLLGERGTGRILGCQIVGGKGAAKRIDTVVAAIQGGLSVDDLIDLDLGYAPPFSPAWDPLLIAARQLTKRL